MEEMCTTVCLFRLLDISGINFPIDICKTTCIQNPVTLFIRVEVHETKIKQN